MKKSDAQKKSSLNKKAVIIGCTAAGLLLAGGIGLFVKEQLRNSSVVSYMDAETAIAVAYGQSLDPVTGKADVPFSDAAKSSKLYDIYVDAVANGADPAVISQQLESSSENNAIDTLAYDMFDGNTMNYAGVSIANYDGSAFMSGLDYEISGSDITVSYDFTNSSDEVKYLGSRFTMYTADLGVCTVSFDSISMLADGVETDAADAAIAPGSTVRITCKGSVPDDAGDELWLYCVGSDVVKFRIR